LLTTVTSKVPGVFTEPSEASTFRVCVPTCAVSGEKVKVLVAEAKVTNSLYVPDGVKEIVTVAASGSVAAMV